MTSTQKQNLRIKDVFVFALALELGLPNELRIDAAEAEKIKAGMVCAAASIRVGLSRTPENTNHLEIKGQVLAGNPQPNRKSTDQ